MILCYGEHYEIQCWRKRAHASDMWWLDDYPCWHTSSHMVGAGWSCAIHYRHCALVPWKCHIPVFQKAQLDSTDGSESSPENKAPVSIHFDFLASAGEWLLKLYDLSCQVA